jgi:hypothetical protein
MANTTAQDNSRPTDEKLERVKDLLDGLKKDAREAVEQNDTFMTSVYNRLVAVCSPIVINAVYRLEREDKAALRKKEKELRKKDRVAREMTRDSNTANV